MPCYIIVIIVDRAGTFMADKSYYAGLLYVHDYNIHSILMFISVFIAMPVSNTIDVRIYVHGDSLKFTHDY